MPICKSCGGGFGLIELKNGKCKACRTAEAEASKSIEHTANHILLSTGHEVPKREILAISGIVASEVVLSMGFVKDIANSFRDGFGGRSVTSQNTLREARELCFNELRLEAARLSCDAVVSIRVDYSQIAAGSTGGSFVLVAATGTAVSLGAAI